MPAPSAVRFRCPCGRSVVTECDTDADHQRRCARCRRRRRRTGQPDLVRRSA